MKLYYKPGACSLASHIVLRELGQDFELEKVDTAAQKTESGADFATINPNGYVPAVKLDSGDVLTEGAAILQFFADKHPSSGLAPAAGTLERARLQEHLNFISSELHKAFSPFFGAEPLKGEARNKALEKVGSRMAHFDRILADGRDHLLGNGFSVADAYLFVVANWSNFVDIDLEQWPNVSAFVKRIGSRKTTQDALRAEGLLQ